MSNKNSKTLGGSMEETKERHLRYLRAMNNPVRREILRTLKESLATLEELQTRTKIDTKTLSWHLDILEWGFCVEREKRNNVIYYILTQEGKVVDFVDK